MKGISPAVVHAAPAVAFVGATAVAVLLETLVSETVVSEEASTAAVALPDW